MRVITYSMKCYFVLLLTCAVFVCANARATVIDFEDLTYVPSDPQFPCFCDYPLSNQYASKGLLISDGFLQPDGITGNYLLGGNILRLTFTGPIFPTYVSMYVSSPGQDMAYLDAYGPGYQESKKTSGYGGPFDDVPYIPHMFVSFSAAPGAGIEYIDISTYFGSRVSAAIDDLTFIYPTELPEPQPFILLLLGLMVITWQRVRCKMQRIRSKNTAGLMVTVLCLGTGCAQATVLNFDDLPYDPDYPAFYDNILTNQYASKGVLFSDAFLQQYWRPDSPDTVSYPNYLLSGSFTQISFINSDLPVFVSMYVSSFRQEVIYLTAVDANGNLVDYKQTTGFGGPFDDTPYVPKQYITLSSTQGIANIFVEAFFYRSTAAEIDDLTFLTAAEVPEPSSLMMFAVGLLGLPFVRRRRH